MRPLPQSSVALWHHFHRRLPATTLAAGASSEGGFRRTLGTLDLTFLGIGVVVGTGIFVLTGKVAAEHTGPAVILSLLLAAIAAGLGAVCYAELAAQIPLGGSVYTYAYATLGEGYAFLLGLVLLMEYTLGAATVAVGWSAYAQALGEQTGLWHWPAAVGQGRFAWEATAGRWQTTGAWANLPAAAIVLAMSWQVAMGTQSSAWLNRLLVGVKLGAILAFIVVAGRHVEPANWRPFLPAHSGAFGHFGASGVLQGAAMLFFAYCGVEALSTASVEARDPRRSIPIAIAVTLGVCFCLYMLVAAVMTGVAPAAELGVADPLAQVARRSGVAWLELVVTVAALMGLTSVLMVQLYCQTRVLCAMARDALMPERLGRLHPASHTPRLSTWLTGLACATIAALLPVDVLGEMCSLATLVCFIAVGACVIVRRQHAAPPGGAAGWAKVRLVPLSTILVCGALLLAASQTSLAALGAWLALGLCCYAALGARRQAAA